MRSKLAACAIVLCATACETSPERAQLVIDTTSVRAALARAELPVGLAGVLFGVTCEDGTPFAAADIALNAEERSITADVPGCGAAEVWVTLLRSPQAGEAEPVAIYYGASAVTLSPGATTEATIIAWSAGEADFMLDPAVANGCALTIDGPTQATLELSADEPSRATLRVGSYTATCGDLSPIPFTVAFGQRTIVDFSSPQQAIDGHLVFTDAPDTVVAGMKQQVIVTLLDTADAPLSLDEDITLTLASAPTACIEGCGPTRMVNGQIAVSVVVTKSGTHELVAQWRDRALKASFDVTPGTPDHLTFTQRFADGQVAGMTLTPPAFVEVRDRFDNLVPLNNLSVSLTSSSGAFTPNTADTTAGVARFDSTRSDQAGTFTVGATALPGGSPIDEDTPFSLTVVAGAADSIALITGPTSQSADHSDDQTLVYQVRDALGNGVPGVAVTLSFASDPTFGAAMFQPTAPATTDASGFATFTGFNVTKVGTGFAMLATMSGGAFVQSGLFSVTPGAADHLAFVTPPMATQTAGATWAPVQARLRDLFDNDVLTSGVNVFLAHDGGAVNGGFSNAMNATDGTGTATLSMVTYATAELISVSANAVVGGPISTLSPVAVNVGAGALANVSFVGGPLPDQTADRADDVSVSFLVRDTFGNPAAGVPVTIDLQLAAGGAVLECDANVVLSDASGVATFTNVNVTKASATIVRAIAGAFQAQTNQFNTLPGAPDLVLFTDQPANQSADIGAGSDDDVAVHVTDLNGNDVSGLNVTLSFQFDPTGTATLFVPPPGFATTNASGVATFIGINVDKVGIGFKLRATAGPTFGQSSAFNVTAGVPAGGSFVVEPVTQSADSGGPGVTVEFHDQNTNPIPGATVILAISANPGGSTLTAPPDTQLVTTSSGEVSWASINLNKVGVNYRLSATIMPSGLVVQSQLFDITAGAPSQIAIGYPVAATGLTAPLNQTVDPSDDPDVRAVVQDAQANMVPGAFVEIGVTSNAVPIPFSAFGPTGLVTNAAGVATFQKIGITSVADNVQYTATIATPFVLGVSSFFNVDPGQLASLVFIVGPSGQTTDGVDDQQLIVEARDAFGNPKDGVGVDLALNNNPNAASLLRLPSTTANTGPSGRVTFNNVNVTKVGTGYTIVAGANGPPLVTEESAPFNVTHGASHHLAFATPPPSVSTPNATVGMMIVEVRDFNDNRVVSDNSTAVGVSMLGGTGFLGGVTTATSENGGATFDGLLYSDPDVVQLRFSTGGMPDLDTPSLTFRYCNLPGAFEHINIERTVTVGNNADADALYPSMDAQGCFVTFASAATDLVAVTGPTGRMDLYVADRPNSTYERLIGPFGPPNANTTESAMSADGRYVAFTSRASNLAPGDSPATDDVFVWDRVSGDVQPVSRTITGAFSGAHCSSPSLAGSGRYIAFACDGDLLNGADNNSSRDVYVFDQAKKSLRRVSVRGDGSPSVQGSRTADHPSITPNGRFIAFDSNMNDLAGPSGATGSQNGIGDLNPGRDIFVHDRDPDGNGIYDEPGNVRTILVSTDVCPVSPGQPGLVYSGGDNYEPSISADGKKIAFTSESVTSTCSATTLDQNSSLPDVLLHDTGTNLTRYVSHSFADPLKTGNAVSYGARISANGGYVWYFSGAEDLDSPAENDATVDVFRADVSLVNELMTPGTSPNSGASLRSIAVDESGTLGVFETDVQDLAGACSGDCSPPRTQVFMCYASPA